MAMLPGEVELERYTDSKAGFTLLKPPSWIKVNIICRMYNVLWISELLKLLRLSEYCSSKFGVDFLLALKVDKAGATVLFEEPNKGSNNVGVVVSPVRLASLGEFGSPQFVADKLIQAEKRKVGACLIACFVLNVVCLKVCCPNPLMFSGDGLKW